MKRRILKPGLWVLLISAAWFCLDRDREVKLSGPMHQFALTLCEYQNAAEMGPERRPIQGEDLWIDCGDPNRPRMVEKRGVF